MSEEDRFQEACMNYIRYVYPHILAFHVPNGGSRNIKEAAKFKRMGVMAGVSDIIILTPSEGHNGAVLELKTTKGRVSKAQKEFMDKAEKNGYYTDIIRNHNDLSMALKHLYGNGRLSDYQNS